MIDGIQVTLIEGDDDLEVVGESFYQDNLWTLVGGWTGGRVRKDIHVLLVAEHDNRYDENAISVWISGLKVGHLSRVDAAELRPGLLNLQQKNGQAIALAGVIVGGGADEGRGGMLGVFLSFNATDFGASATPLVSTGSIRTGLSNALTTDDADDNYDLGWLDSLSPDSVQRISQLRHLIEKETKPISRHYILAELEGTLYRCRDAFPGTLEEYDAVCGQHDSEMNVILPALVEKFGVVPLLGTYRQAAIRHQKAKDYERALWWAERGIDLYGDKPAKQDMLLDLHKRATLYRDKLTQPESNPGRGQTGEVSAVMETLSCQTCNAEFQRPVTRGRKPLQCPACREAN